MNGGTNKNAELGGSHDSETGLYLLYLKVCLGPEDGM